MTSKILLRIGVTIGILALIFLGVWLIWFKPSNELEVFNNLTQLQSQNQTSFEDVLNSAKERNYMEYTKTEGDVPSKVPYTFSGGENDSTQALLSAIKNYRAYMFGEFSEYERLNHTHFFGDFVADINLNKANIYSYLGFYQIYNVVDTAFEYYYSYAQLAEHVSNKDVKNINNLISAVKSNYSSFITTFDEILKMESQLTKSDDITMISEIKALYYNLYNNLFNVLKSYNNLTLNLKEFVNNYVFDGNIAYDKQVVAFDVLLNSTAQFVEQNPTLTLKDGTHAYYSFNSETKDVSTFSNYFYNASVVAFVYKNIDFTTEVEQYNNLVKNYSESLFGDKSIFKLTREQMKELVNSSSDNLSNIASQYNVEYLTDLQSIVKLFFQITQGQEA